jgi:hypothetical protein
MRSRQWSARRVPRTILASCRSRTSSAAMMGPSLRRPLLSAQDLTSEELGRLGPLGARALIYVRDHCPTAFATIPDPVRFFVALGEEIGDQVLVTEQGLRSGPVPGEDWASALGEIRMTHLAAESQVFQEMVFDRWPTEDESEDLMPDPADPAYNRYLSQLADLRAVEREARAAMEQADLEES